MLFEVDGNLYRVDFSKSAPLDPNVPRHRFFVSVHPNGEHFGVIDRWDPEAIVVPEQEPLEETVRVLKEIARQLCEDEARWAAMGRHR
jgi:hypothetical protein